MKTKKEIREIIKSYLNPPESQYTRQRRFGSHEIIDGKIRMKNYFVVFSAFIQNGRLALDFDIAYQFRVITDALTSLEGFPWSVDCERSKKDLYEENYALKFYSDCLGLSSLEGLPSKIHGNLFCDNLTKVSYKHIHKHLRFIDGVVRINNQYEGPLLGFLLIEQTTLSFKVTVPFNSQQIVTEQSQNLNDALKILNRHIAGDKDLIDCQQDLINAGLKQFANI